MPQACAQTEKYGYAHRRQIPRREQLQPRRQQREPPLRRAPQPERPREKKLKFSYNEQREFETIDAVLAELEEKLAAAKAKAEKNGCTLGADYVLMKGGQPVRAVRKMTAEEIDLAERLLRILSVNAALTFPISVFESHVTINEQYLFQKLVAMGKQVLNPLIMIPLLLMGYGSVMLTIVSLVFTVVSGIINIFYCLKRLKMPFAFRRYDFALLREMFGFTVYVFIGIVVDNLNWSIDRQLLTWFHGSAAVTVYSIAAQLNNYFLLFGNAISNVMTPRVHRLVAENAPMRTLDALFTKVGRLQFILLGCIFLGFVAVGQSFVVLWGGGEQFRIDYWTALLLFFACLWTNIQTVGIEIQRAKNMHKYRSLVYLGVLVGNTLLSIPLCIKWEGLGAAIGTAVATIVGNVFLMNLYYYKHIGLNIPAFWRHISHLLPAMLPPAVTAVLLAVFVHPASYWALIPPGLLVVAVYGASMWLFGMNRYERSLITGPLRRIVRR